jgi:signal transduction histidine kinase/CheY-like chemotaxis protein
MGGAFSMGVGIWSMHFIGMLAFNSPVPLGYDITTTLISLLIAIVASGFALYVASRPSLGWQRLTAAAVVMGIAIVSMHYVGMAAIVLDPPLTHAPPLVIASIVVAVAASLAALAMAFKLRRTSRSAGAIKGVSALLMGIAIAGMHYTAMAGVQIAPGAVCLSGSVTDPLWLAAAVAAATLVILSVTLVLSLMDAHLARRTERMTASLEHAQESNKAKDEFLAMLGHELRNPLAAISNAVALLDTGERRSATDQFAREVMHRQVTHLNRMIDDLVDAGRVTAGKLNLHLQPLDLYSAACNAVGTIKSSGRAAQHHLECSGEPVWINGDSTRVEQVVSNLLTNALTYSPPGSSIHVNVERVAGEAVLTIKDTGIGLSSEELPRVFELFYQSNRKGLHRTSGGLGIGLTLVRRLVDLHEGRIRIDSAGLGTGTTVTVVFNALEQHSGASRGSVAPRPTCQRKVIVVDDDPDIRESLRILLSRKGHTVITAEDGERGVQCIKKERPEIGIIDIAMPRMDGYELAQQVRTQNVEIFLVALTGYGQSHDKTRAREAGFDAHMTKPADVEKLDELINMAP